jgi:hypothetical protein
VLCFGGSKLGRFWHAVARVFNHCRESEVENYFVILQCSGARAFACQGWVWARPGAPRRRRPPSSFCRALFASLCARGNLARRSSPDQQWRSGSRAFRTGDEARAVCGLLRVLAEERGVLNIWVWLTTIFLNALRNISGKNGFRYTGELKRDNYERLIIFRQ